MDYVWEIYLYNIIRNMLTRQSTMAENMNTNEIPHQSLLCFGGLRQILQSPLLDYTSFS